MDYGALIKRAWEITKKYKFLWIFGILAGGGFSLPSFDLPSEKFISPEEKKKLEEIFKPEDIELVKNWIFAHLNLLIVICLSIFLFFLILFILSVIFKGALVGSVGEIEKNKEVNFKRGFQIGSHHFWRIIGLSILFALPLIILGSLIFISISLKIYLLSVFLAVLSILIFLLLLIFIGISSQYALRFLILEDLKITRAIFESFSLFKRFWKEVLLVWLIAIALSLAFGIGVFIGLSFLLLFLGLLGFLIYTLTKIGLLIYGILLGLALLIGFFILSGAISTFLSSFWTLAYLELRRKELRRKQSASAL